MQEIFAVKGLSAIRCPDLVKHDPATVGQCYVLVSDALAEVPRATDMTPAGAVATYSGWTSLPQIALPQTADGGQDLRTKAKPT